MKTGVLLINLGTPRSSAPKDVKAYLTEFLTDPLVIDLPFLLRQFLVRGVIIPRRYKESAQLYQKIWTQDGSPLLVHTKQLKEALQISLGPDYIVEFAMRYQEHPIESVLDNFLEKRLDKIVMIPLFPQYAQATTGSIKSKILSYIKNQAYFPAYSFVSHYEDSPLMTDAYVDRLNTFDQSDYDHLMISFHGLPVRQLKKFNTGCVKEGCCNKIKSCYKAQCFKTANAIIKKSGWDPRKVSITFQSRLGKEEWMTPYTSEYAKDLLKKGNKRILVMCPSFVSDCLETLSEIKIEYSEDFIRAGGEKFDLVPSLNTHNAWVEALKELTLNGC